MKIFNILVLSSLLYALNSHGKLDKSLKRLKLKDDAAEYRIIVGNSSVRVLVQKYKAILSS